MLGFKIGELGAAVRYLSQGYTTPTGAAKGPLTDIGTEELAHLEIIATMVYKLLKGVLPEELRRYGLGSMYSQHDHAIFPSDAKGVPWTAAYIGVTGDPIADLNEDLAAEQKARAAYEHLIALTDDACLKDGLKFLREREVAHYQRFGETLRVRDFLGQEALLSPSIPKKHAKSILCRFYTGPVYIRCRPLPHHWATRGPYLPSPGNTRGRPADRIVRPR